MRCKRFNLKFNKRFNVKNFNETTKYIKDYNKKIKRIRYLYNLFNSTLFDKISKIFSMKFSSIISKSR